ncbi:helix-turn-helix domain-containing protein [Actinomadura sp. ATCC 31491]|uniref:Helix-turn-helix domain-containing protein n=1 Tax=Actinomadura luzonensis TaxID=2805427 RepID=A0ABT0FQR1_9ACTN|nr:helix-turn-helix transcriptional regulator [Actinomadura luzonensis]MCK2214246.1 helix-turn-helix domain-containing protein [Actinomadura luzonensis]
MSTITPRRRALYQNPAAVRRHRILAGLTQMALAARAEVTDAHVSKIENGKSSVSPEVLARIANELGCKVTDLLAPELQPQQSAAFSVADEKVSAR